MKLYNTHAMNWKKIHGKKVTLKYLGKSKALEFENQKK